MLGWWILFAIFLIMVFIVMTPVRISVYYGRVGDNDHLVMEVSAWFRIIRRKFELPVITLQKTDKGPELRAKVETVDQQTKKDERVKGVDQKQLQKWKKNYQKLLKRFHDFQPIIQKFLKQVRCQRLEWHTVLGAGDAAETGAILGVIWGVKSIIVSLFSHAISLRSMPRLSVQPVWNQMVIRTQARIILHFRLGHALLTGIRLLVRLRQKPKPQWKTTPSGA